MATNSKLIDKKVVLFSNDPGGAQILSSYFHYFVNKNIYLCSNSKTEKFFIEKNVSFKKISFNEAIEKGDIFFTSTSWKNNLEIRAIKTLKNSNRRVITFIDGWTNYKARFLYKKKYFFPDEIWTFDSKAYYYCKKTFSSKIKVKRKQNYFLKYVKEKISKIDKGKNFETNCAFFTEPLTATHLKLYKKKPKYSELDAFKFFLKNINKLGVIKKINVKIHPNDKISSYLKIIAKFKNLNIKITNDNIYNILARNYFLASCTSSVMYLGYKNKNKIICVIPKKSIKPNLPIQNMTFLINL